MKMQATSKVQPTDTLREWREFGQGGIKQK